MTSWKSALELLILVTLSSTLCSVNAVVNATTGKNYLDGLSPRARLRYEKVARNLQDQPLPSCLGFYNPSVQFGMGPGWLEGGIPGDGNKKRFGMPNIFRRRRRGRGRSVGVRKAWHTLPDSEKEKFVQGVVKMKQTKYRSGLPGSERAGYNTFCSSDNSPTAKNNLYDFYVELHYSTYASWGTQLQTFAQRCHQGPMFLPWHRYFLLRFEADMRDVLGDPDYMLPYWDYDICEQDSCPLLFDEYLGSQGGCDEEGNPELVLDGYLFQNGFTVDVVVDPTIQTFYNPDSVVCIEPRPLARAVGCEAPLPSSSEILDTILDGGRATYDEFPYNSCEVDENVSFRQYLEGFEKQDDPNAPLEAENVLAISGGTGQHADAHLWVGADLGFNAMPDPIFVLLHANIDRIWALWQVNNMENGSCENYGNPGYPEAFMGSIFNFPYVFAHEMFAFDNLGYRYDWDEADRYKRTRCRNYRNY